MGPRTRAAKNQIPSESEKERWIESFGDLRAWGQRLIFPDFFSFGTLLKETHSRRGGCLQGKKTGKKRGFRILGSHTRAVMPY